VGALFVRQGLELEPLLLGAGHERGLRAGTENVPAIVGLGAASAAAQRDLHDESARVRELRDRLWSRLAQDVPGLALNGHPTDRLPNTLNVRFPHVSGAALLSETPEVAASTGSACHEGMAKEGEEFGMVRLTLGRSTTAEDVDHAAAALARAWRTLVATRGRQAIGIR
jgi:cysteine desulfurase